MSGTIDVYFKRQLREVLLEYGVLQDADGFHWYRLPETRDKLNLIIDDSYASKYYIIFL